MKVEEKKKWIEEHWSEIENFNRKSATEFYQVMSDMYTEEALQQEIEKTIACGYEEFRNQWMMKDSACKEEVCGIEIHNYLEEIRYCMDGEKILYLIIDQGKVVDKIIGVGSASWVDYTAIPTEILTRYYREGKQLYCCHNHPCRTSAIPSWNDVLYLGEKISNYDIKKGRPAVLAAAPERLKKYKLKQPYKFVDWGIVTALDYYSFQQIGDVSERLLDWRKEKLS